MLDRWEQTLAALERDPFELDGQLDWVTKWNLLRAYVDRDGLALGRPEARAARPPVPRRPARPIAVRAPGAGGQGRAAASTRPTCTRRCRNRPPTTRAYFRGTCLAPWADSVVAANWDSLVLDVGSDPLRRIPMMEPTRGSKEHVEQLFARGLDAPPARRAAGGDVGGHACRSGSANRSRRPRNARKRSSKTSPATSRARREAEGRHRRSAGRNRLRARGQRGGVRPQLRPEGRRMTDLSASRRTLRRSARDAAKSAKQAARSSTESRAARRSPQRVQGLQPRGTRREVPENPGRPSNGRCSGNARIPSGIKRGSASTVESGKKAISNRKSHLKRKYGLTLEDSTRCSRRRAACARSAASPGPRNARCTSTTITTPARSAACCASHCNNALGDFRDEPELFHAAADVPRPGRRARRRSRAARGVARR